MKILVTGVAGFIGFHTAKKFLDRGDQVIGIDSINNYYDQNLKKSRLKLLRKYKTKFIFIKFNIANKKKLESCFNKHKFERVVHLAAQAGVRYSLKNPEAYVESNLIGFTNILFLCKKKNIKHLTYASTSSVYGLNSKHPFSESDNVDHPIQFYAATKRANEIMAHSYSYLFNLPTTGLRFFTVYGPWGRPDMSLFIFTKNIISGKPIEIFNKGKHVRDFTYIDDIVNGVIKASDNIIKKKAKKSKLNPGESTAPFRILNIGNSKPVNLMKYIDTIEENLKKKAIKKFLPLQQGDVPKTFSDTRKIKKLLKYKSKTSIKKGIQEFINWYLEYYKIKKNVKK